MDIDFLKSEIKRVYLDIDGDILNNYFLLFENKISDGEYTEMHHILPKCDFPEYRLSTWNFVRLSFPDHLEAHRLLWQMTKSRSMLFAYNIMLNMNHINVKTVRQAASLANSGNKNPSKRKEVRLKISKNKKGKRRNDMLGKEYFGSSKDTIEEIHKKLSEGRKNTVIVKDSDNNRFLISKDDPRYISGELVHFSKGIAKVNNPMKSKSGINAFKKSLNDRKEKFSKMSAEDICKYLISEYIKGKKIFHESGRFGSNYSRLFKYANLNPSDYLDLVKSQLEGSTTIESTPDKGGSE